jgi:hypothetical protein
MALENAESVPEPYSQASELEQAPDSSPLRVSLNTQFESGIPPARLREESSLEDHVGRMEMALAGVTRTEANLGLLIRGLKHLAGGVLAAREANTELTHELDALRTHLGARSEQEHALRFRMGQLEQLLDVIRHETSRERQFLIEQQDLFLIDIMSDHDRQIAELHRSIRELSSRATVGRQRELDELTAQRDQAREYATRCERERDAAWQELAASETTPARSTLARPSSSSAVGSPPPLPALEADFSEVSDDELRVSSPKASGAAIGSISLRAVQVPASQVAAPKPESPERTSSGTGYSRSREEIAD